MSYLIFARKYRPATFDEVVGQEHIVTTLKNAVSSGKLAHAYIFAGPRGIGKTSCARILAKSLNCEKGPTLNPCNKCPACQEISESRSMDVIEIDGASNRGIDEIRTLRENVKFAPTRGKYKIYIIDEFHQITADGFNALLKTLEEPPAHVKFIFATTAPHKVLPTILSRCQRFDFRHVPVVKITAKLEEIAAKEKLAAGKDVLFLIAKAAQGSLRDAESILDQLSAFTDGKIETETIYSLLGMVRQDFIFELTQYLAEKDGVAALTLVNRLLAEGKDINQFIEELIAHFRNLMVARIGGKALEGLLDLPEDLKEKILQQANLFSLREILTAIELFITVQEKGRLLDSARIPLEMAVARISYAGRKEVTVSAAPAKKETAPAPHIEPPVQAQEDPPANINLEKISTLWSELINRVGRIKMSVATYLSEAVPLKMSGNNLLIGLPKAARFHKETLEHKDTRAIIEETLKKLVEANIKVHFEVTDDKKVTDHEPVVKSTLDVFKGKVVHQWHNHEG
ncbi:MAG: DNA polymerase III subunit gamma/tau [Candidatus Omnitrophota bacterium]